MTRPSTIQQRIAAMDPNQRQAMRSLLIPRVTPAYFKHTPWPKQQVFLTLNCREALYGGAAGGGKSDAILMAALQYVDVPGYSALIIRRTWPDLTAAGAIMDRAKQWLAGTPAQSHEGGRWWTFPTTGAPSRLSFGYLQHENDKHKFASAEYQFIAFDELTHFQETQYSFLFSRLRRPALPCMLCGIPVREYASGWKHTGKTTCRNVFPDPKLVEQFQPAKDGTRLWDVPLRMRSGTNPGAVGHEWVYRRFVDPKTRHDGVQFIPASLRDNPALDQEGYIESLSHLNALDRERLLNGDWSAVEQGDVFQREWFEISDAPFYGSDVLRCRYWDMAATEPEAGKDPDYTVGALVALRGGQWMVEDIVRGRWGPRETEKIILQTAMLDGRDTAIRMEQEPGSSGKIVIDHYRRNVLVGFNFDGDKVTGSKVARSQPLAVAAEKGNLFLLGAQWNKALIDEAELFPKGAHDDQVDAMAGATNHLAFGVRLGKLLV